MSKPNCGAIVAPCHYPMCLSLDGRCSWPPTMSAPEPSTMLNRVVEAQRDAARAEVAALRAENERLRADAERLREKIAHAYGHLWHVNNEPLAPVPLRSNETAAYAARRILRDTLTSEQRGAAINAVREELESAARAALEHKHG